MLTTRAEASAVRGLVSQRAGEVRPGERSVGQPLGVARHEHGGKGGR